jgi:hypothetical protein
MVAQTTISIYVLIIDLEKLFILNHPDIRVGTSISGCVDIKVLNFHIDQCSISRYVDIKVYIP